MISVTLKIPASARSFYDFLVNKIRGDRSLTPDLVSRSQGRRLFTLRSRFEQFRDWLDTRRPDGIEAAYSASTSAVLILTAQDWRSLHRNIPHWAHQPAEGATEQSQSSRGDSHADASIHPTLGVIDYSFPPHDAPPLSAARDDSFISTHQVPSPANGGNDDAPGASPRPAETNPFRSSWKSPSVPVPREMPLLVTLTPDARPVGHYGGVDPTPALPLINHRKPEDLGDKSASSTRLPGGSSNRIRERIVSRHNRELPLQGNEESQQDSVEHPPIIMTSAERMLPPSRYQPRTIKKLAEMSLAHRDLTSVHDINESTNVHVSTNGIADPLRHWPQNAAISPRHNPTAIIPPLDPHDIGYVPTPTTRHIARFQPLSHLWTNAPQGALLQSGSGGSAGVDGAIASSSQGQGAPPPASPPPAVHTAPRSQEGPPHDKAEHHVPEPGQQQRPPHEPDLDVFAVEVLRILKSRLAVERERLVGFV